MSSVRPLAAKGFTLVELITVLAVGSILVSLSVTAFQSLARSTGVTAGASNLASLLERAQAYAMANCTYVYVGLDATSSGDLLVATMFSPTADSGASDTSTVSSVVPVSKAVWLRKVTVADAATLQAQVSGAVTGTLVTDARNSTVPKIQMTYAGESYIYPYVIKFCPDGSVTATKQGVSRYIQIGLTPTAAPSASHNGALLQISGLTGDVQVFRP